MLSREREEHWQRWWEERSVFRAKVDASKRKYYVLDMFPYPSGAGLHVGHPLGYIATDVVARYRKMKGYNVLHPMGFDAFGLPAEQYAIQTGRHPVQTTMENIRRYRQQLKNIGLAYDWEREVVTCAPAYYRWTQWLFIRMFESWYDTQQQRARPIGELEALFEREGNRDVPAYTDADVPVVTAEQWRQMGWAERQRLLMNYRLAYLAEAEVNWCEALGTVLANEEVVWDEERGLVSVRGGHPVVRLPMRQWFLRIRAYAERLLANLDLPCLPERVKAEVEQWWMETAGSRTVAGREERLALVREWHKRVAKAIERAEGVSEGGRELLLRRAECKAQWLADRVDEVEHFVGYGLAALRDVDGIEWFEWVKEAQRHWIGRSVGAQIRFMVRGKDGAVEVFTTRPDTIFGVTFVAVAPEHPLLDRLVAEEKRAEVWAFVERVRHMPERERIARGKPEGVFTGACAVHPFTGEDVPIWVADYVVLSYGTGAVMGVPAHDQRDWLFAHEYRLPVKQVIEHPQANIDGGAWEEREGTLVNSGFLDGLAVPQAIEKAIEEVERRGVGRRRATYRLRDFLFSRQRYWGEPIPVVYVPADDGGEPVPVSVTGLPELRRQGIIKVDIPEELASLPVELPNMDSFEPTGEPPLARLKEWVELPGGLRREVNTMPGWAGSNWYFIRYMDPHNQHAPVSRQAELYWGPVDLYVGGAEHATAHLIYARFVNMFLYDIGVVSWEEPFRRLYNQGMILGSSYFILVDWQEKKAYSMGVGGGLPPAIRSRLMEVRVPTAYINEREELDMGRLSRLKEEVPELAELEFVCERDGRFLPCNREIEKMSKSMRNTINPDEVIERWGADAFRLYEMFMGPLNESKPWDVRGITGTHRFLQKLWRLFVEEEGNLRVTDQPPTQEELRVVHYVIRQVTEDIEQMKMNTAVSALMSGVNRLQELGTRSRQVLEVLLKLVAPFAPHIAEELWHRLGNSGSIFESSWPVADERYLREEVVVYPVMVNGRKRFVVEVPSDWSEEQVREYVLASERLRKYTNGKQIRRVIVVRGKVVSVVV